MRRIVTWWKHHLERHHGRLIEIKDSPHSIALGSAVGIFVAFTPLFGVKTLLSVLLAWLFRSNKFAAAISVTLFDVTFPLWPILYWWEYKLGYFLLHDAIAPRVDVSKLAPSEYLHHGLLERVIWPALIGSFFFAIPAAVLVYALVHPLMLKARARRGQGRSAAHDPNAGKFP